MATRPEVDDKKLSTNLLHLIQWKDHDGQENTLRLYIVLSSMWEKVSDLLIGNSHMRNLIAEKNNRDPEKCIRDVIEKWMQDEKSLSSNYKCTWNGLCSLLEHLQQSAVASDLRAALAADISSFNHNLIEEKCTPRRNRRESQNSRSSRIRSRSPHCRLEVFNKDEYAVSIFVKDKECHRSMKERPPPQDEIVIEQKHYMYKEVDLKSFAEDLKNLGSAARLAYYGIGAAGSQFQKLQNKAFSLLCRISKLGDKSFKTVHKFQRTTDTIIGNLLSCYNFLLSNYEEVAVNIISSVATLADQMLSEVRLLLKEFEDEEKHVEELLNETEDTKADQDIQISHLKEQRKIYEERKKKQNDLVQEHKKLEKEFRAQRRRAEEKELSSSHHTYGFFFQMGNLFTAMVGSKKTSEGEPLIRLMLKNEMEQQKLRMQAYQSVIELTENLRSSKKENKLGKIAVSSLQETAFSLHHLIVFLRQACDFWTSIKLYCDNIKDQKFRDIFMEIPPEERKELWMKLDFKKKMFVFIAQWVALNDICSANIKHLKCTNEQLRAYILENPTYKECRAKLPKLIEDFQASIES